MPLARRCVPRADHQQRQQQRRSTGAAGIWRTGLDRQVHASSSSGRRRHAFAYTLKQLQLWRTTVLLRMANRDEGSGGYSLGDERGGWCADGQVVEGVDHAVPSRGHLGVIGVPGAGLDGDSSLLGCVQRRGAAGSRGGWEGVGGWEERTRMCQWQ